MRKFLVVAAIVAGALSPGCKKIEPPQPLTVKTIAILPFDNESNDLNAPDILQILVYTAMKRGPYEIRDIKETNDFLSKKGIVDGGQLAIADPMKMGRDLGVQALMYGTVEDFNYTNVGYYIERKVTLDLKLVEVETGAVLWENSNTAATRLLTLDKKKAAQMLVVGLADQWVDKLFKKPLQAEAQAATVNALRTMPGLAFLSLSADSGAAGTARRMLDGLIPKK